MIRDKNKIYVLSYLPSCIALSTRNRSLVMAASDGITPTREQFSFEEIEYINDHSPVFRLGMLEFADADKNEIYEELNITPEKCLYERDIDALLLKGDKDALARIVAIADVHTIGRVRGHMVRLAAQISTRVVDVVNYRYNEIRAGQRTSKIVVEKVPERQDDLRDQQMRTMQKEMEAMRQLLAQLVQKAASGESASESVPTMPVVEETPKRRGGRPPKNAPKEDLAE